jgi:copper transport protein
MRLGGARGLVTRALLTAGLALVVLVSVPSLASAHAVLVTSSPRWGAVLGASPRTITLSYSEDVVPRFARVAIVTPRGENLAGTPEVSGSQVVVPVRAGPTGSYTVRWQMVASDDGHVTQGAYSFGVRAKPLPPAPASGLVVPVAPELLAWLQFLGVVLTGGALTFRALVSAPAARRLRDHGEREAHVAIGVAVVGAALALHTGLLGFLVGAYPIVGGGLPNLINTQIIPIRVATHIGQAWTLTTFAWLGVLALLVAAWVTPRKREPLLASAGLLSLGIAFGISWASHPAARGTLALAADYAHLVGGALWVGGVVALVILARAGRSESAPGRDALVRECLLRFSRLAVPIVIVLASAGAYVAVRELPSPAAVLGTVFGVMLLVKTAVFMGALGVGGYHRRSVVPRIAAGVPVASLRRTLAVEASLLLVALALAATLSQIAPPR